MVEREGVSVVDREAVEVKVEVMDTLGLPLAPRELVPHEVGEFERGTEAVAVEEGVKEEAELGVAATP